MSSIMCGVISPRTVVRLAGNNLFVVGQFV
jgi:hypothetical protein